MLPPEYVHGPPLKEYEYIPLELPGRFSFWFRCKRHLVSLSVKTLLRICPDWAEKAFWDSSQWEEEVLNLYSNRKKIIWIHCNKERIVTLYPSSEGFQMVPRVMIGLERLRERFGINLKTKLRKPSSIYVPTPKSEYVSKKPSRKPSTVIIEEEPEVRV